MKKGYLTKSMMMTYRSCPKLYEYQYVQEIPSVKTPQMERGVLVHKFIEHHNKKEEKEKLEVLHKIEEINETDHVASFMKFDASLVQWNLSADVIEGTFHYPERELKGIIDVTYTDGNNKIVLDYKTGTYREYKISDYRMELSFYKHLLELAGHTITHWGMYFTGDSFLWKEKIEDKHYQKGLEYIEDVKKKIKAKEFPKKFSNLCNYCQFKGECWK